MPAGPPGWIRQTHQEPGCEFELVAWELVPVELGSGPWIGPTLPRRVGDVAPFHPHLSLLLLPGGGDLGCGGWGGGGWGLPLGGGGGGDAGGGGTWEGKLGKGLWGCAKDFNGVCEC